MSDLVVPDPKVFLGVVLNINGKDVALAPKDAVSDIDKKGIDVGLPEGKSVNLGSAKGSVNELLKTFTGHDKVKLPEAKELPDFPPLQNAYKALTDANITIEDFHLKIPGKNSEPPDAKEIKYTVGLSATWKEDQGTLFGGVKLKGIYLDVSNERTLGTTS